MADLLIGGLGGGDVFGEGAEEAALGVFEGEGGTLGEEGLDGFDDGLVLLVGAGIVGGEGEDVLAIREAEGEALVLGEDRHALVEGRLDKVCLGLAVAGLDEVLDEGCGVVGGEDGEGGPELCVECGEDVGDLALGDIGEAGDDGAALLEGDVDGRVGEGVGAELLSGLHAMLGDGVHALDEGGDGVQDVLGEFVAGVGGAVEVFGLGVLDVAELVIEQVVGQCGRGLDFLFRICDSINRRGLRLGGEGYYIVALTLDRPRYEIRDAVRVNHCIHLDRMNAGCVVVNVALRHHGDIEFPFVHEWRVGTQEVFLRNFFGCGVLVLRVLSLRVLYHVLVDMADSHAGVTPQRVDVVGCVFVRLGILHLLPNRDFLRVFGRPDGSGAVRLSHPVVAHRLIQSRLQAFALRLFVNRQGGMGVAVAVEAIVRHALGVQGHLRAGDLLADFTRGVGGGRRRRAGEGGGGFAASGERRTENGERGALTGDGRGVRRGVRGGGGEEGVGEVVLGGV